MKLPNYTFEQFLELDDRDTIETAYAFQDPFPVDCKSWTFGKVKEMQIILSKPITYEVILDVVNNIKENALHLQANIVFGLFTGVIKSINEITEIEQNNLSSAPTPKEIAAMESVGGFERFGKFPEILSVARVLSISYEKAYETEWSLAFSALLYDKTINDYQKQLYKND